MARNAYARMLPHIGLLTACAVLTTVVGSNVAHAAGTDLSAIGGTLDSNFRGLSKGVSTILNFTGFTGAGVGVYKLITHKKTNEPMSHGLMWLGGGALMLALPFLIGTAQQSTLGSDQSGGGLGALQVQ